MNKILKMYLNLIQIHKNATTGFIDIVVFADLNFFPRLLYSECKFLLRIIMMESIILKNKYLFFLRKRKKNDEILLEMNFQRYEVFKYLSYLCTPYTAEVTKHIL